MSTWKFARNEGRVGTGNWEAWSGGLEPIYVAAEMWKKELDGIDKPWLCWNIEDDWCKLQQKLVLDVGWTPVVGNDCGIKKNTILNGSVYLNFNSYLKLPCMWMHFPLEFVFLFAEKMAFWHSDLICSIKDMRRFSEIFKKLNNGETAAVKHLSGWLGFKDPFKNHFGELIGCTTKSASKKQFENGCGWWRHVECHPNREKHGLENIYYEHGTGIYLWSKKFKGKVRPLKVNEKDGHATVYRKNLPRGASKTEEMQSNFDLVQMCKKLKIEKYL